MRKLRNGRAIHRFAGLSALFLLMFSSYDLTPTRRRVLNPEDAGVFDSGASKTTQNSPDNDPLNHRHGGVTDKPATASIGGPHSRGLADRLPDDMPAPAYRSEPELPRPAVWPFGEAFPRTSGTTRLFGGAVFASDFLYDDHGALGVPPSVNFGVSTPRGTYRYRPGPSGLNGADIFRAAIGRTEDERWFRVDWNTLIEAAIPIAAWAIDSDDDSATGTDVWSAGAKVSSPGIDATLVVSSRGAWLYDDKGSRAALDTLGGQLWVDMSARSFIVRLPASALPSTNRTRVRLAAGLASAAGDSFAPVPPELGAAPGQPAVYNMAFRSYDQESGYWMENRQAAVLAEGDASEFGLALSWDDLLEKRVTPEPLPRGFTNRWYVSSIEVKPGQGLITDANGPDQRPNFFGRVQPYSIYVPRSYDPRVPTPLTFMLHALNLNHNQFGVTNPRFMGLACESRGAICVGPEGRGPDGYTADDAELDFFEVWNRVATNYAIDPDRTSLVGYSMGGFGVYRQGLLYPHLFSRAVVLAGPPTCGIRIVPGIEFKPEPPSTVSV